MKKTLYPKTLRIGNNKIIITEKLDGSNLGIFKINGKILIAQRNNCFYEDEIEGESLYKGLAGWLKENTLDLIEGRGVFGEWIGMGKISYGETDINKRFYIFAKANINEKLEISNINYNRDLFIYPFESQKIPDCMGIVPGVLETDVISIDKLNNLYDYYCNKINRKVEGFIINDNNIIKKYVRLKNGILTKHITYEEKTNGNAF